MGAWIHGHRDALLISLEDYLTVVASGVGLVVLLLVGALLLFLL